MEGLYANSTPLFIELVESAPELVHPRVPLGLIKVASDWRSYVSPGSELTQCPGLPWLQKVPVDSSGDISQVKRLDARVIFWHHSFLEDEKCVTMHASVWWWS